MHTFFCPIGFAHGFCVLSHVADVLYKQSNYYSHETEQGIAYDDPDIGIEWPLPSERLIASERTRTHTPAGDRRLAALQVRRLVTVGRSSRQRRALGADLLVPRCREPWTSAPPIPEHGVHTWRGRSEECGHPEEGPGRPRVAVPRKG
jgi:dTDP-4-dehydrorhamnose 3,5-epimerase